LSSLNCQQKAIKAAYHTLCDTCATKESVCAKCREPNAIVSTGKEKMNRQEMERTLERLLKDVPERRRRTILRKLDRGDLEVEEAIALAESQQKDEDFDDFSDDEQDSKEEDSEDEQDSEEEKDSEVDSK
jgi:hypothetical protein